MGKRIRLIINGKSAANATLRQLIEQSRSHGHEVSVRATFEEGDAERFAKEALGQGLDSIVAVGGDGTLNEVLQGMLAKGKPVEAMGLLPMGTANDFAHGVGISADNLHKAMAIILNKAPRPIDVGMVNGRAFLNVVTGGFGSQVTVETNPDLKRVLGKFSYLLTGIGKLFDFQPIAVELKNGDASWQGELMALAVGNGWQAGGGIRLCPDACLDDGLLDITLLPHNERVGLLDMLDALAQDGLQGHEAWVKRGQAAEFEIIAEAPLHINLDGEPMKDTHFRFSVLKQQLSFHLPE
ncbi:lipid kinase YegS [Gallaecimonas pentaromativorans]|uniref:Lipid kinase YegS n=1 Tax=Gallaecimonas pentaromativorans TaxID=584787 RepID=A0A3N1PPR4_9GAMM|nr:lipid kinase YegS [Gallaecimonas pentaromativorans]ROQ30503.1 lipid kinase YegS [Gallaecimonas pentaromativorans]